MTAPAAMPAAMPAALSGAMKLLRLIARTRRWLIVAGLAAVVVITLQRGVFSNTHTTFPIFRQSYHHLVTGSDLYAMYPAEQGNAPADRFKYSPTAALLYGPFAIVPSAFGLLLWNLLNATALFLAFTVLLRRRAATLAMVLTLPFLVHSLQSSSSNGLVAALIIFAFVAIDRGSRWGAATLIALGTLIKLFPIAALTFALFSPKRWKFVVAFAVVFAALLATPLLVTPLHTLLSQYDSWRTMVLNDEVDLTFGLSVMRGIRVYLGVDMPNWPLQAIGTALLVLPLALHRERWHEANFRRLFLSSVLVFCVVFNHQAEHQSFVIAAAGMGSWYVTSARTVQHTVMLVLALVGIETLPFVLIWMSMQADLIWWPPQRVRKAVPSGEPDPFMVGAPFAAIRQSRAEALP